MAAIIILTSLLKERCIEAGIDCQLPIGASIANDTELEIPCSIKRMTLRGGVRLGAFSYAVSGYFANVTIGRYASIGEDVQIGRGDHPINHISTSPFFFAAQKPFTAPKSLDAFYSYQPPQNLGVPRPLLKKTRIGNDVWIGHGAFLKPGITIGDGAVIAACAVVVKDVGPYEIVGGNPARVLRSRFSSDMVADLLDIGWWRFAPWQLRGIDFSDPECAIPRLREVASSREIYPSNVLRLANLTSVGS